MKKKKYTLKISKSGFYIAFLALTCSSMTFTSLADSIDSSIFNNQLGVGYQTRFFSESVSNVTSLSGWSNNEVLGYGSWRFGDIYVAGEYKHEGISLTKGKTDTNKLFKQNNTLKLNGSYVWTLKPNELEVATGVTGYLQQVKTQSETTKDLNNTFLDTNQERRGFGLSTRLGWNIIKNLKT